jgi:hypothetical protein
MLRRLRELTATINQLERHVAVQQPFVCGRMTVVARRLRSGTSSFLVRCCL